MKINNKKLIDRRLLIETDVVKVSSSNVDCFFIDYLNRKQIELFKKVTIKEIEISFKNVNFENLKIGNVIKIMNFEFEIKTILEDWIRLLPIQIEDIGIESYDVNNYEDLEFNF